MKLPVASWILPITQGFTTLDRLPSALTRAMPPAAAVPDRIAVGNPQKTGMAPNTPKAVKQSASSFRAGTGINAAPIRPTAEIDSAA